MLSRANHCDARLSCSGKLCEQDRGRPHPSLGGVRLVGRVEVGCFFVVARHCGAFRRLSRCVGAPNRLIENKLGALLRQKNSQLSLQKNCTFDTAAVCTESVNVQRDMSQLPVAAATAPF